MAIGDQYNDLEMIGEVGHGVAMPSAPAAVLAAARYVAPPVAEEGAAQMIERIALSGWQAAGAAEPLGADGARRVVEVERR
jgi:phosphoserine phosphatase